jgi:sensor histidine kinase YesM
MAAVLLCSIVGIVPVMQAVDVIGVTAPATPALRTQAVSAVFWMLAAQPIALRWSLADSEARAMSGLALLAVATTALLSATLVFLLRPALTVSPLGAWMELTLTLLPIHALTVGLISLVGSWTSAKRQRVRAANREAVLAASLVRAELDALRNTLQPHFLLNALNTIAGLARRNDGERAGDVAADLGALLRFSLDESSDAVPFDAEREMVERYLAIEQARLGARLRVVWDIASDVRSTRLPAMIWQPLVENAIRHGIAQRVHPGTITLTAHRESGALVLTIDADGPDTAPPAHDSHHDAHRDQFGGLGLGLQSVQRRLELLYGPEASVLLTVRPDGSRATLRLPAREL